jgi:hypothetical protein
VAWCQPERYDLEEEQKSDGLVSKGKFFSMLLHGEIWRGCIGPIEKMGALKSLWVLI